MKRLIFFFVLFFVAQSMAADGPPAGTIVYSETPEGVFLLLADHAAPSKRGWASFAGHHEDGETAAETAARETEEETRGYFKKEDVLKRIKDQSPIFDGPFAFFFLKVDHIDIAEITAHPIPPNNRFYRERGPYAWVPLSEIMRFLDPDTVTFPLAISAEFLPEDRNTDWIWPLWLHNLAAAMATHSLPWEKEPAAITGGIGPIR